jgi:hypothetical protein
MTVRAGSLGRGISTMKKYRFSLIAAWFTLALAGGVSTATGCGGAPIASLCEHVCACLACSGKDLQVCEDKLDSDSRSAAQAGCASEFDDTITCTDDQFSCQNGGDVGPFAPGCSAERAVLTKCLNR